MDNGVQLGPLTTKKRLEEIEKLVEVTKKEGAKVLCGGKRPSGFNKGYFYEPTVFDNVKDNFKIMTEEPFGPLTPILTFKNFDEVIKKANNQVAGLAAYVCTNSLKLANRYSTKKSEKEHVTVYIRKNNRGMISRVFYKPFIRFEASTNYTCTRHESAYVQIERN